MNRSAHRKQAGDVIAPLALESIQGESISIPHASQLTHLQFRRFAGCPMCNLHVQTFVRRHEELLEHGVQTVAVFHSSREAMRKRHAAAPFPLIADPGKELYREFGVEASLMSVLSPGAWAPAARGMLRHGVGLPAIGETPLGLPADFLIDTGGKVLASKYGTHAYDHWEVDEVLELAQKV